MSPSACTVQPRQPHRPCRHPQLIQRTPLPAPFRLTLRHQHRHTQHRRLRTIPRRLPSHNSQHTGLQLPLRLRQHRRRQHPLLPLHPRPVLPLDSRQRQRTHHLRLHLHRHRVPTQLLRHRVRAHHRPHRARPLLQLPRHRLRQRRSLCLLQGRKRTTHSMHAL